MPWLFFLKASAEVESADHLYAVEDGVRFDNRIRWATISEPHRALKGSSMSPHRSSSRAMDLLRNHAAKLLSFRHVWNSCPELREGQKNLHILQITDDRILPIIRGSKFKYINFIC